MKQHRVLVFEDDNWQEIDMDTKLVLCSSEALADARASGRAPKGIEFELLPILLGFVQPPGE